MKEILQILLTIAMFVILSIPFGLPRRMDLIERDTAISPRCLVDDNEIEDVRSYLQEKQPEVILLGNSMLGTSVDEAKMNNLLGMNVSKVWLGGSGSAWWFLFLKNIVADLEVKPNHIFIFFRDNYLTLPQHKTAGYHKIGIDNFAGPDEELLDSRAYFNTMSRVEFFLYRYLPLVNKGTYFKEKANLFVKDSLGRIWKIGGANEVDKAISTVFADDRMNGEMFEQRHLADEKAQDLYREDMRFRPDESFLSAIIDQCRKHNISLAFVRVKRVRDLQKGKQSKELLEYMARLNTYLDKEGVALIDFTNEDRLKHPHFGKSDHLNRGIGREYFTRILSEQIGLIIEKSGDISIVQ
jgi:hypothetical protein